MNQLGLEIEMSIKNDIVAKQKLRNVLERFGFNTGHWYFSEEEKIVFSEMFPSDNEVVAIAAIWPAFDDMELGTKYE